jgi:CheY-like chemotaxis protein/Tfp pilus assembly protein PilF
LSTLPFILYVDDGSELPEGLADLLEQEGYRLTQTCDPEEAMRLARVERPDLVLMEVELAECNGLDLMAGIRDASGAPVIVLSRAARNSGVHGEAIAIGIADFLAKPVRPTELLARLRRRGATGVLAMGRGSTRIGVQLRNGSPIALTSNRAQHDSGLARSRRAEALLYETFCWGDGPFGFSADRELSSDVLHGLEGDPETLVLLGVLDASPIQQVRDRLAKRESLYVSVIEGRELPVRGARLTSRQKEALAEQNGTEKLSALLESKVFDVRLLYGLWVAGWLDFHTAPVVTLTELLGVDENELPGLEDAGPEVEDELEIGGGFAVLQIGLDAGPSDGGDSLAARVRELAEQVLTGDDFDALDLRVSATDEDVRSAYEWILGEIPDPESVEAGAHPTLMARLIRVRSRVEAAYQNLKDPEKRDAYALLRAEEQQDRDAKPSAARALEGERWFRKGKGRLERRHYQDAVEAFGMAAHMDPAEGEYLANLGYALYMSNPGDEVVRNESLEHIANGIKRSPRRGMSYVYLGRILKARGDVEAARKVFTRALRISPDCRPAQQEMRVLKMRERKEQGKGFLTRLLGRR